MLKWSLSFFVVAIIAAIFGYTNMYPEGVDIFRFLFYIFLVLCLITLFIGLSGRGTPRPPRLQQ